MDFAMQLAACIPHPRVNFYLFLTLLGGNLLYKGGKLEREILDQMARTKSSLARQERSLTNSFLLAHRNRRRRQCSQRVHWLLKHIQLKHCNSNGRRETERQSQSDKASVGLAVDSFSMSCWPEQVH